MREYLILTATFTVPFIVLALLNLAIRLIRPISLMNPSTTERR